MPPADVGVDISTWVVGVSPSTVQVYMQRMSVITTGAQQATALSTGVTWRTGVTVIRACVC